MLTSAQILDIMLHCVPSWSDIRKRTKKSTGGALLRAYANTFDDIQLAIDDYVKDFFLVSYFGKENDYIDYLMIGLVGSLENLSLEAPSLEITRDLKLFYGDWHTYALYQNGYILIHPDALGGLENCIYTTVDGDGDVYKYSVKLTRQHIWNVFDEFALFAGITRYEYETNAELTQRTLLAFQRFANASEIGLKNAVKNAVQNYDIVTDEEIIIEQPNIDNMSFPDTLYGTVYERLSAFNQDIFRQKQWDKSLWFHDFKSTAYLPHQWDKEIALTQNGVGANDSLKIDYLQNIGQKDYTNVTIQGFKKSEKAIKEYIRNNNIETSISLQLDKYEDAIKAEEVQYKIIAKNVVKINPDTIWINALQQLSGEGEYDLADLVDSTENIESIHRGTLETNKQYRLEFTPTEAYSAMNIYKCLLRGSTGETDLRQENNTFIMQSGVLVNKNVLAHITSTSGLLSYENLKNMRSGLAMDMASSISKAVVDVTDMGNKLLVVKVNCPEADITSNTSRVVPSGNFQLSDDELSYYDNSDSFLSALTINMTCNSYSFSCTGPVEVTTVVNGTTTKKSYTKAQTISNTFRKATQVQIYIRKNTDRPVAIKNIQASAYELNFKLDKKEVIDSGVATRLPVYTGANTLTIELKAGTQNPPTIEYIHIGPSIKGSGSTYTIDIDTTGITSPSLDIDSTCNVALYDVTSVKTLISDAYTTKTLYKNVSNQNGYIFLDTTDFINIRGSLPLIQERYNNGSKSYIVLQPGEEIDKIVIDGEFLKPLETRSLSYYLCDNDASDKEVYVSSEPYFIVRSQSGDIQKTIVKSDLNTMADTFRISNLPSTVNAVFQLSGGASAMTSSTTSQFVSIYLQPKQSTESVAYNSALILQEDTAGIEIVNTFTPIIDLSILYLYVIEPDLTQDSFSVEFDGGKSWSLGVPNNGIVIHSNIDYNNKTSYSLSISFLNGRYILHNRMPLESRYSIGGEIQELAKFVITPQAGFTVGYEDKLYEEQIQIDTSRFNKLTYTNISSVSVTGISSDAYQILGRGEEGILVWNDNTHVNQTVNVSYIYKSPIYLHYADATTLYNLIQYNISAYEPVGEPIVFYNVEDEAILSPQFVDQPDIIITKCSNDTFETLVNGNIVSVHQVRQDNKIAIHNGWLYDDGLEYWRFTDKYVDSTNRFENIVLHNVVRFNGELLFNIKSVNYLPYSSMTGNNLYKLADFDFTKRKFKNVSRFNSYTACDSYNGWILYNFDITPSLNAYNDFGLEFKQRSNTDKSYAAIDITDYLIKGHVISLWTSGDLSVFLAKETQYDHMSFARSLCIEENSLEPFSKRDAFWYRIIKENPEPEMRYYLCITGSNGVIDDLVNLPYTNLSDMISAHKKNIHKLNFYIEEELVKNTLYPLEFDYNHAAYQDIDYNHEMHTLRTSTNVTYGLTKISDIKPADCKFVNARITKDQIFAHADAKVTTPAVYVKSPSLIYRFYIKVNDFHMDKLKNFKIRVYTNGTSNANYIKIFEGSNINIAEISSGKIKSYVYAEIEAENGKVINNIEFYARYRENEDIASLVPVEKNAGQFISKIYDIGSAGTFVWDSIDYEVIFGSDNAVRFYLRGAKTDNNSFVFSDWHEFVAHDDDNYKVRFKDYRLFQYKIDILNTETEIKIHSINLKAVQ